MRAEQAEEGVRSLSDRWKVPAGVNDAKSFTCLTEQDCNLHLNSYHCWARAWFFASTRDECRSPRVRLECNPEIPVAPVEEHWLLDTSLDEGTIKKAEH